MGKHKAQVTSNVEGRGHSRATEDAERRRKGRWKSPGLLATVSDEETAFSCVLRG